VLGIKSRLKQIQAAVLSVKLKYLDQWNAHRQTIAQRYTDELNHLPIQLPKVSTTKDSVWHLYVIATSERAALQAHLADCDVQTLIHYPVAPHRQSAYQHLNLKKGMFPESERYAEEVLSLPIGPQLSMTAVDKVIETIKQFYQ